MSGVDVTRLRWRLRGAWQGPVFIAAVLTEAVLLNALPVWGDGPGGFVPGLLLAMALNLVVVAAIAPVAGMLLRRRRRDLPRAIANDYSGTALIGALLAGLLAGGLVHRSEVVRDDRGRSATAAATSTYVHNQAESYAEKLGSMTVLRLEPGLYRSCVPGPDPDRALCLFVNTDQSPAGVRRDPEGTPNQLYGR